MTNPTDGSLYYFDQQKNHMIEPELKKMGPTIPQMIESSPTRSEDGLLYTGDKKDRWQIIDPQTGEVLQRIDQTVIFKFFIKDVIERNDNQIEIWQFRGLLLPN